MDIGTQASEIAEPHASDEPDFEAGELLAKLKALVDTQVSPDHLPDTLNVSAIVLLPGLFQPRCISEQQVMELVGAPKRGQTLAPVTVLQIGGRAYLIDGHHRIAAYKLARFPRPIPVVYFRGTVEEAVLEAGRANSRAKLNMSTPERMNFAWRLVRLGTYSKSEISEAASVSDGQVGIMRKTLKALGVEAWELERWMDAKKRAEGRNLVSWSPEEIDDWKETQAQHFANRLAGAFSTKLVNHPEISAHAISIHFGRRLPQLVHELRGHLADVDLEDDDSPF